MSLTPDQQTSSVNSPPTSLARMPLSTQPLWGTSKNPSFPRMRDSSVLIPLGSRCSLPSNGVIGGGNGESRVIRGAQKEKAKCPTSPASNRLATERGIQQGLQQGKLEGILEGKLEGETGLVERLITRRFGPASAETQARLTTATLEQLEQWAENILDAATRGRRLQEQ